MRDDSKDLAARASSPGHRLRRSLVLGLIAGAMAGPVLAASDSPPPVDITRRAERLPPLLLDAANGVSVSEYTLRSGVYYRWRIESDGREEYKLVAPELFRESWIDQVVIEDIEVKPMGLHAVEFDDAGTADIWMVVLRPGTYEFWVEGLREQGFSGRMIVK